jgi:hypothetical protein
MTEDEPDSETMFAFLIKNRMMGDAQYMRCINLRYF